MDRYGHLKCIYLFLHVGRKQGHTSQMYYASKYSMQVEAVFHWKIEFMSSLTSLFRLLLTVTPVDASFPNSNHLLICNSDILNWNDSPSCSVTSHIPYWIIIISAHFCLFLKSADPLKSGTVPCYLITFAVPRMFHNSQ